MGKLWFRRKRYGWGWTPAGAAGWLVMVVFIAAVNVYPLMTIAQGWPFSLPTFLTIVFALVVLLIAICFLKGERPAWSWGDRDA